MALVPDLSRKIFRGRLLSLLQYIEADLRHYDGLITQGIKQAGQTIDAEELNALTDLQMHIRTALDNIPETRRELQKP